MPQPSPAETCLVEDTIQIAAAPERVFRALTEGAELERWWPKTAQTEPVEGGELAFTWLDGSQMRSRFELLRPLQAVAYPFYAEKLEFRLQAKGNGTELAIRHECGTDSAIHVAQSWGFLKANLKCYLEKGWDLRS